jgi:hypothetical protein
MAQSAREQRNFVNLGNVDPPLPKDSGFPGKNQDEQRRRVDPFAPRSGYLLLAGSWALVLLLVTAMAGPANLVWISLPFMLLILIVVWGLCAAFTRNLRMLPCLSPEADPAPTSVTKPGDLPLVTIVSTARNEAVGIEAAVRSLAALDYPALEILVVDDHSTDETPQIIARLSRELPRVRAAKAPPLEAGWVGKNHAAWFGSRQGSPGAQWLLFADARVVFHPLALRRAVALANQVGLDFLSCLFFGKTGSLCEELIGPFQMRFLIIHAQAGALSRKQAFPVGIGPFMMVRRNLYEAFGGHAANPAHPIEDAMLALTAQRHGGRCALAVAPGLLELRRYHGYRDLRPRAVRAARLATSDSVAAEVSLMAQELLLYVLPVMVLLSAIARQILHDRFDVALTLQAVLATLTYLAGVLFFARHRSICQFRPRVAWVHPLGAIMRVWFRTLAIEERLRGQQVIWRDRAIPVGGGGIVPD